MVIFMTASPPAPVFGRPGDVVPFIEASPLVFVPLELVPPVVSVVPVLM
jgi:hypothetical protein